MDQDELFGGTRQGYKNNVGTCIIGKIAAKILKKRGVETKEDDQITLAAFELVNVGNAHLALDDLIV